MFKSAIIASVVALGVQSTYINADAEVSAGSHSKHHHQQQSPIIIVDQPQRRP